jgi:alpha-1,6-mannosyltransferase
MAVAVEATRHASHADGSPIDPAGAWRSAWIAGVVVALALCGVGVLLARRGALSLRAAVIAAVVVQALPLFGPLLLSRDVFIYWAEARVITVHHANPYRVTPSQYPQDPGTQVASPQWRTQTEPYGPAWAGLGTLPALAAGTSQHTVQLLYRLLAWLAVLASLGVIAARTRSAQAVALFGWSPLIALHYAGGGHSDAVFTFLLVCALALGTSVAGGAAWPLAAMFKAVPLVVLPLELARRRLRVPRRFWLGLAGSALLLLVVAVALFGTSWVKGSLEAAHGTSPIGGVHFLTEAGVRHRYAVALGGLVFVAVYLVLLRVAWRTGRAHAGFALVALVMCSSLLRPWYALWPLAVAAFEEDGLSMASAYALVAYGLFADALPDLS